MLYTILIVVLILALIGALPTWPHAASWSRYGYGPAGGLGLLVLILLVLVLTGRL